jgi:hypothetical protein
LKVSYTYGDFNFWGFCVKTYLSFAFVCVNWYHSSTILDDYFAMIYAKKTLAEKECIIGYAYIGGEETLWDLCVIYVCVGCCHLIS